MYCLSSGPTDSRMYLRCPMMGKFRIMARLVCKTSYTTRATKKPTMPKVQVTSISQWSARFGATYGARGSLAHQAPATFVRSSPEMENQVQ